MKNNQMIFGDQWTDIVFENRNTAYGAYVLRKESARNNAIALFTVLLGGILLFGTLKFYYYFFQKTAAPIIDTIITIDDLVVPPLIEDIKTSKPPLGNPPPDDRLQTMVVKTDAPDLAKKDSIEQDNQPQYADAGNNLGAIGSPSGEIGGAGLLATSPPEPPAEIVSPKIPDVVEEMPTFPGGEKALYEFIQRNLNYPRMERENGIEGKAVVSFVIRADGKVTDVKTLKSDTRGFSSASEEVITQIPKFIPGKQGGKNVAVRIAIPIRFRIQ